MSQYKSITLKWAEQLELIKDYKVNKSNRIKEILISANIKWISSIIIKNFNYPAIYDELLQEAVIKFSNLIDKFDETRGFRLTTLAYYAITNHLRTWVRQNTDFYKRMEDSHIDLDDPNVHIEIPYYDENIEKLDQEEIKFALEHLTPEEKKVVINKYALYGAKKHFHAKYKDILKSALDKMQLYISRPLKSESVMKSYSKCQNTVSFTSSRNNS